MDEFSLARTLETIAIEDMSLEQLEAVCRNDYVTRSLKKASLRQHRVLSNELDELDRLDGFAFKTPEMSGPIAMAQRKVHGERKAAKVQREQ